MIPAVVALVELDSYTVLIASSAGLTCLGCALLFFWNRDLMRPSETLASLGLMRRSRFQARATSEFVILLQFSPSHIAFVKAAIARACDAVPPVWDARDASRSAPIEPHALVVGLKTLIG
jgi:hypothetical protein